MIDDTRTSAANRGGLASPTIQPVRPFVMAVGTLPDEIPSWPDLELCFCPVSGSGRV